MADKVKRKRIRRAGEEDVSTRATFSKAAYDAINEDADRIGITFTFLNKKIVDWFFKEHPEIEDRFRIYLSYDEILTKEKKSKK